MLSADQIATIGAGALLVLAVLAPAGALLAWLLRRCPLPGGPAAAGILGGAIAGLLLGATVLGHAAPQRYAQLYIGGIEESRAFEEALRDVEREVTALRASGVSSQAVREHQQRLNETVTAAAQRRDLALDQRAKSLDAAALGLGCVLFALGAGWAGKGRQRRLTAGAVASGFGMVIGAGAPVCLAAAWLGGFTNTQAWTLGAVAGIGSAWPALRARRIGAAGRSPETEAGALVALVIGTAALVMATLTAEPIRSFTGVWTLSIVAVLLVTTAWRPQRRRPRSQRRALALAHGVVIPALTAVSLAPIDLPAAGLTRAGLVATVAMLLFAADGRWFGAWFGWRVFGDAQAIGNAWRRGAAMLACNVGAVSIAAAALGRSAGLIGDEAMLAVVSGALLVECTTGLRGRFAATFDATKHRIDENDDPER